MYLVKLPPGILQFIVAEFQIQMRIQSAQPFHRMVVLWKSVIFEIKATRLCDLTTKKVLVRQLLRSTAPILGVNLLSAHGAKKTPVGVKVDLPEVKTMGVVTEII
jgi:hypothetical protein